MASIMTIYTRIFPIVILILLASCQSSNNNNTLQNLPPTAQAQWSSPSPALSDISLSSVGSADPEGKRLVYSWTLSAKPAGSGATIADPTHATTSFSGDVLGDYEFTLVVNDGILDSAPFVGTVSVTNTQPVASARVTNFATTGQPVLLDGRASSDDDGHNLTYQWNLVSKPATSSLAITTLTGVTVNIVADVLGDYVFELVVNDGIVDSAPVVGTVSITNTQPIASAPATIFERIGQSVLLDGSASSDDDGHSLTYQWNLVSKPATSSLAITTLTGVTASFDADVLGDYVFELMVNDGIFNSVPFVVTATVTNTQPIASAPATILTTFGQPVLLDGSTSSDDDGHSLTYQWNLVSKPATSSLAITTLTGVTANFDADVLGNYVFDLVVNDGILDSAPFTVTATVTNTQPIASAPATILTTFGQPVLLDGSTSSDDDGHSLTYQWNLVSKPATSSLAITTLTGVTASFDADVLGDYEFTLVVNDGVVDSAPFSGTVTVTNTQPVASAPATTFTTFGQPVFLDGRTSSDDDGHSLTYQWNLVGKPASSSLAITTLTGVTVSFYADVLGDYEFTLVVNDGVVDSAPFLVTATVTNTQPIASAPATIFAITGRSVMLDGSASSDDDGHSLTYQWTLVSKPATSSLGITTLTGVTTNFTADVLGDYVFELVVDDNLEPSLPATTTVSVIYSFTSLSVNVTDAEYSNGLEKLVFISADSRSLHTFNPEDGSLSWLSLPLTPTAVSVSPDGLYAAVGHNTWISYVNLSTNVLEKTFSVSTDVLDVILDGNGYVHAFPRISQWEKIRSVNIATEVETLSSGNSIYSGTLARLHPDGTSIYGADNGISPSDIEKYDISGGTAAFKYDSPYHGTYAMCGNLWMAEDGQRIFTRCGNVFKSSSDQAVDMTYNGSLDNFQGRLVSLNHSSEAGKIISIVEDPFGANANLDTHLFFHNYEFLTDSGSVELPRFPSNHTSHGKFVFYNSDGTQYLAIVQADAGSGLLNDFAIITSADSGDSGANKKPVADSGLNRAMILGNTITLDGSGSSDENGDTLTYSWTVVDSPAGSTPSLTDANTLSAQFSADVTGDYVIALTVSDGSLSSNPDQVTIKLVTSSDPYFLQFGFSVTDAEYSDALERIVVVSSDSSLYTFNTTTYDFTQLDLPLTASSVSVSPDGIHAAVGHNGWITYVNLSTNTIVKTVAVTADVLDVVLDGNGYVHAFPRVDQWVNIHSINLATETETTSTGGSIRAGTLARLHPDGTTIYGADNGLSPSDIEKYDISAGTADYLYDSPYHGDYPMCGNLWFTEDGAKIITRCGKVFKSSTDPLLDMVYAGALGGMSGNLLSVNHSSEDGRVAAIATSNSDSTMDTKILFYNSDFMTAAGSTNLPSFEVGASTFLAHGKFVFFNSTGTRYFSIVQADGDSGLLNDFGISVH